MRPQQVIRPVIGREAVMRLKLKVAIIASLVAVPAIAAEQATPARGTYVGVFGGWGSSSDTDVAQLGTVFFVEAQGGPLAVNATGQLDSDGVGFVGGQVGHEWSNGSVVLPAFELEGFALDTGTRRATLLNPNVRLVEQEFESTFPTDMSVFLANLVISYPTPYHGVTPYIGSGIGGAQVDVEGATSLQLDAAEPGINHFNSGPDSSAWTFAAQIKAGARLALGRSAYVFGEYRYLYVGSTDQIFGPTDEPTHAPTTAWTVRFDDTSHHLATAGVGLSF
jgi:opacity protein-like surface antigen